MKSIILIVIVALAICLLTMKTTKKLTVNRKMLPGTDPAIERAIYALSTDINLL